MNEVSLLKFNTIIYSWYMHAKTHIKTQYKRTTWMNGSVLPKTESKCLFISAAVCEPWTGGLGFADATAVVTPVDLWLVKAKHSLFVGRFYGKKSEKTQRQWSVIVPVIISPVDVCRQFLLLRRGRSLHAHTHWYYKATLTHHLYIFCMKVALQTAMYYLHI